MRRHHLTGVVLSALLLSCSGCIDIGLHYLIRENGSVRVTYDIVLEKMMMQLIYGMPDPSALAAKNSSDSVIAPAPAPMPAPPPSIGERILEDPDTTAPAGISESDSDTSTPPIAPSTPSIAQWESMFKPFKMTKESCDSVGRKMFGSELSRLSKLPSIISSSIADSLGYDGVHILFTTELRSYKDIAVLHKRDTSHSASHKMRMSDSVYVKEESDSVLFMVADLSKLNDDKESLPSFPMMRNMDNWYKKTDYVPYPHSSGSSIRSALWSRTDFQLKKKRKRKLLVPRKPIVTDTLPVAPDSSDVSSDQDSDNSNSDGDDSKANDFAEGMKMFGSMLSGLINIDVSIQAPTMLSYDLLANYDTLTHTASWHMDIGSIMKMKESENTDQKYYVWFRKPH